MEKYQKDLLKKLDAHLALAVRAPSLMLVSEWAEKHRYISPEANAKGGGPWRNLPMQIEPMDACLDPSVEGIVLMFAAQTAGKTEILLNIAGYFMHQDPSPMMMLQPTLDMAEDWSTRRCSTMIRDTPVLADLFSDAKRTSTNKILEKGFPGGSLVIAGANSPASLASRPIRIILKDEIDRFPVSAGKEGDPSLLAAARQETFYNAFDAEASTPTVKRHSRIESSFQATDQRYWYCPCPSCGHPQRLKWKQLKWESEESMTDAYYLCENEECDNPKWTDAMRIAAIKAGKWVATAPFKGIRGYHLNGLYSLFPHKRRFKGKLHQFVSQFLKVVKLKNKKALQVWTNTFLAETWSEDEDVKPDWAALFDRREKYTPDALPNKIKILTVGADFQADRIELEIVGWAEGEESWGIEHIQLWGDPRNPEIFQRLEAVMCKQYRRQDGGQLSVNAAGFDTGYWASQRQLYAYLRPRLGRRYYPFKGSSQKNAEPISHSTKGKTDRLKLLMVGTNRIKSFIYNRSTIGSEGSGYMHFPESYTAEWFKQLLAEDSNTVIDNGNQFQVFYMPAITPENGTDRNEALDMRVYALGALYARGIPNWKLLEKRIKEGITEQNAPIAHVAAEPEKQGKKKHRRGSFVSRIFNS